MIILPDEINIVIPCVASKTKSGLSMVDMPIYNTAQELYNEWIKRLIELPRCPAQELYCGKNWDTFNKVFKL